MTCKICWWMTNRWYLERADLGNVVEMKSPGYEGKEGMRRILERIKECILRRKLDGDIIPKGSMMKIGSMISRRKTIIRSRISSRRSLIWCLSTEYQRILRFNTTGVDVVNATYIDMCSITSKIWTHTCRRAKWAKKIIMMGYLWFYFIDRQFV